MYNIENLEKRIKEKKLFCKVEKERQFTFYVFYEFIKIWNRKTRKYEITKNTLYVAETNSLKSALQKYVDYLQNF